MKPIFIAALAGLSLVSQAHAAEHQYARGTCHITTLNESGTVVKEEDISLVPVDPFNHFGLALTGHSEPFSVKVQLMVGRYDHIGENEGDRIALEIVTDVATAFQELSGKAFAAGESLQGSLQVARKEMSCVVGKN